MRRLPIYLLIDVSGSMRGEPIEAINQGIKVLIETLNSDPYALETAYISIITFNNIVSEIMPLTEVYKFRTPNLQAMQGTYVGKALRFLSQKVQTEVVKTSRNTKGDWKPIAFIMTDGKSGDKIEKAIPEFDKNQFSAIVVCAYGDEPRLDALKLITPYMIHLEDLEKETLISFFRWISYSVSKFSLYVEETNSEITSINELPPLPPRINLIKTTDY